MKQAIIILAHKEIPLLMHLVDFFERDCYVFIHIDKRTLVPNLQINELKNKPQVVGVYQKYEVHWGGFSVLQSQLFMLKEAFRLCDAVHFHVISGQDYPIKSLNYFLNFFKKNAGNNFILCNVVHNRRFEKNAYSRYQYFYPYDFCKNDRNEIFNKISKWTRWQRKLHINRGIPSQFDNIYCGSQWFSLSRSAIDIIIQYTKKHPSFYKRMRYTFAPEETYFQTVVVNLCERLSIINNNMRLIRWHDENGNSPANLGVEHFHLLAESHDMFARKMQSPYCINLIKIIDKYLLSDKNFRISSNGAWNNDTFQKYEYDYQLTEAIFHYCKWLPCYEILDIGCGPGLYVAALRRLGLFATGYDANPYTEDLSKLLLPNGDEPCGVADLTENVENDNKFGMVMCINVLQYLNNDVFYKAVDNLIALADGTLLLGWDKAFSKDKLKIEYIFDALKKSDFCKNVFATEYFHRHSKLTSEIYLFENNNKIIRL
jgi:SAM-dependent methyltransferase